MVFAEPSSVQDDPLEIDVGGDLGIAPGGRSGLGRFGGGRTGDDQG